MPKSAVRIDDRSALALDARLRPLTRVVHLDNPTVRPRLIRLLPRDAVAWCYADYMGEFGKPQLAEPHLRRTDNGWICGIFWAQEGP